MGYFSVRYDSRVVIYYRRGFIRLVTGDWIYRNIMSILHAHRRGIDHSELHTYPIVYAHLIGPFTSAISNSDFQWSASPAGNESPANRKVSVPPSRGVVYGKNWEVSAETLLFA